MALREHAQGLYTIDHALRVGGLPMGARTSAIRLRDGGLFVHSPGPLDDADERALSERGTVRALVAPNALHHLFLRRAHERFPEARLFGSPAALAKEPGLPLEALGEKPAAPWAGEIEQIHLEGVPRMDEFVFFHPATRTLLVTDLVFHLLRVEGALARAVLRLNQAYGCFGPSRALRLLLVRDRAALRRSLDRVLAWDFDRLLLAHGEPLEQGARPRLRAAFAWLR
jgi:hypothetical protein